MNIRQLEYFVTIAETGQITEAAQKLYIAQPPLSRSMKRLEAELGVALYTRTRKGLELTSAGLALYEKSKQLLRNYRDMLSLVRKAEEGVRGHIRIGSGYPTIPLLPGKIAQVQKQYPSIDFHVVQEDPDKLLDMLEKDEVDLIFSPHPVDDSHFVSIPLEPDPLVLVVNPELDPVPEEDSVPIEKPEGIPLCMLRSGDFYGYNEILINECEKYGFTPRILCQCNSASTAMIFVMQGLGLSYQPKTVVDTMTNSHLYGKEFHDFESYMRPAIMLNRDGYTSEAIRIFLSLFQAELPLDRKEFQGVTDMRCSEENEGREQAAPSAPDEP